MILVMINIFYKNKRKVNDDILSNNKTISLHFTIFFVGLYGGFIHAGVGFLMILILNGINRYSINKANSIKVFVALLFTFSALFVFFFENKINVIYGINLAIGSSLGGWLTSRWSIKKSERSMRYIICLIILILALRLWIY